MHDFARPKPGASARPSAAVLTRPAAAPRNFRRSMGALVIIASFAPQLLVPTLLRGNALSSTLLRRAGLDAARSGCPRPLRRGSGEDGPFPRRSVGTRQRLWHEQKLVAVQHHAADV